MKRNWDTIREILARLEELPDTSSSLDLSDFSEERAAEISYHLELLLDAGLVEGEMEPTLSSGPTDFTANRLTWNGHEFLDSVRSDTVWNKTKKTFATKGIDMTFDLVRSIATEISVAVIRGSAGV
jgi:DNA-binding transcriptional ArsR family regulator